MSSKRLTSPELRSASNRTRTSPDIMATPYEWRDPASIPPRSWLLGHYLSRGLVSITVAPGGVGKSALSIAEAVSLASGVDYLAHGILESVNVWYYNLEDCSDEIARRIQAICLRYQITKEMLSGRLMVDSGLQKPLTLATATQKGHALDDQVFLDLAQAINQRNIDVLIIDPLVSAHALDENSNMHMDALIKGLARIADHTKCAISLIHHTRKSNGDAAFSTESARGAKSISDAVRTVRVLQPVSASTKYELGVEVASSCIQETIDKQNFAARDNSPRLYRMVGVELGNGDEVGVVTRWQPSDSKAALSSQQVRAIQGAFWSAAHGEDSQAADWAGIVIAEHTGLDLGVGADVEQIKALLQWLIAHKWLRRSTEWDTKKGRKRPMVVLGNPVSESEEATASVESAGRLEPSTSREPEGSHHPTP